MDIRYAILHFTIEFESSAPLPRYKGSALRGGIGEMLLSEHCIQETYRQSDRCAECSFRKECIPQRILYASMDLPVKSMNEGSSEGYVVECEDYREEIQAGDRMKFRLLLIGKVAAYLAPLLNAVYRLGLAGLGKDHVRFQVVSIKNSRGQDILGGQNVYKENYLIEMMNDYIDQRRQTLNLTHDPEVLELRFLTPVAIKKDKKILERPSAEDILIAVERRIHILKSFEGIPSEFPGGALDYTEGMETLTADYAPTVIPRYSFRKSTKSYMKGSYGSICIQLTETPEEDRERILRTLLEGELFHVGSNTSFGFGRYVLKCVK